MNLVQAIETSKNSVFWSFRASFVGYSALLGSRVDFLCCMNRVHDDRDIAITLRFCCFEPVSWVIVHCFGLPGRFLMLHEPVLGYRDDAKTNCFRRFARVSSATTHFLWSRVDFLCSINRVHCYRVIPKTRCFCRLGLVSWAIAHCFGVSGRFSMLHEPCARLPRRHKNSLCFVVWGQFRGLRTVLGSRVDF